MLKKFHTITIKDFSLFEQTGDTRYLIRWGMPIGWLYTKRIAGLLDEITRHMGSQTDADTELQRERHRLKTLMQIQYLMTLYQATVNLLVNKTEIDVWKTAIGKNKGSDYSNLIEYTRKIEDATGIVIEPDYWIDSLYQLRDKITWMTDKYNEAFMTKQDATSLTFLQIVLGVFAALQLPVDEDMRLITFLEIKQQAEQIALRLKLKANGRPD